MRVFRLIGTLVCVLTVGCDVQGVHVNLRGKLHRLSDNDFGVFASSSVRNQGRTAEEEEDGDSGLDDDDTLDESDGQLLGAVTTTSIAADSLEPETTSSGPESMEPIDEQSIDAIVSSLDGPDYLTDLQQSVAGSAAKSTQRLVDLMKQKVRLFVLVLCRPTVH